jgi:xylan 1,4-beta-xylosidase
MRLIACGLVFLIALAPLPRQAQEAVTIRVNANARLGPLKPIWAYVGYDEPNYTYMKYGPKL